ncbi:hypothetical protein DID88_008788 [Monilinia fructigena]|uniref:Uncharacterized protein n=1 Tax=Monilinia fructigena TaxID=38457 RepID=A0A395J6C9_9HELO|nr:hypothetical protein DID88_008788 [Monilinia fructigena]
MHCYSTGVALVLDSGGLLLLNNTQNTIYTSPNSPNTLLLPQKWSVFSAIAMFVIASALSVQACTYCQCEFSSGAHCCVYFDAEIGNLDCASICANAHRADGTDNNGVPGTACNAGGKYRCANTLDAQDRTPCYKQETTKDGSCNVMTQGFACSLMAGNFMNGLKTG